jgi:hypothetical protein
LSNLALVKEEQTVPELRIVKVSDLFLIPKYLLDQVKDVYWTPDELYGLWPTMEGNVGNLLFALVDKDHIIKGVVWCSVVLMGRFLFVNIVSLDKEYQNRHVCQNIIAPYLRKIKEKLGLTRIIAVTSRPKTFEVNGWKTSKHVIEMED